MSNNLMNMNYYILKKGICSRSFLSSCLLSCDSWFRGRGGNLRCAVEDRREGLLYLLGIIVESRHLQILKIRVT